jgi:AcrR family transcriptional regulator
MNDWTQFQPYILQLEEEGLVTRTYRRLDPERQQAVFNAILEEASEHGPAALNIKRVAQRAGVAIGSLYQYFNDRDNMLNFAVELCVRYITDLFNQFRPYLAAMPLREALAAYLAGGIEWSKAQAGLLQLFARAAYQGDPELADRLVKPIATLLREMVTDMLTQAAERGEIRPGADLEAVTRIIHALTIAVSDSQLLPYLNNYFQVTDAGIPVERTIEALLDLIFDGIGVSPI